MIIAKGNIYFYIFVTKTHTDTNIMGQIIKLYTQNPDYNSINSIVKTLERGGLIIIPTDSYYALACSIDCAKAISSVMNLKNKKNTNLSIICNDTSMASKYITFNNEQFKILKQNTPNPITFIFEVNKRFPNAFIQCKKTVGIRIVDNQITAEIVERLGVPIVATTISLNNSTREEGVDPSLIWDEYKDKVDMLIDGGEAMGVASMVVDLTGEEIEIIRDNDNIELKY